MTNHALENKIWRALSAPKKSGEAVTENRTNSHPQKTKRRGLRGAPRRLSCRFR
jgi:hypothetical protein